MRPVVIMLIILAFTLLGLFYAPETTLEFSVIEIDNGVRIENTSNVDCIVFVSSLEGERQFELANDQSIVIIGIKKPIEVSAVMLSEAEIYKESH